MNAELLKLEDRTNQFLKKINSKHKVVVQNDSWSDPGIEFDGTGIGISMSFSQYHEATINGTVTIDKLTYAVYTSKFIPGTRYHRDGSGTPDDVDIIQVGESFNLDEVIMLAILELVKFDFNQMLDDEADEEHSKIYDYLKM